MNFVVCSCSMAGTEACKNCNVYKTFSIDFPSFWTDTVWTNELQIFNPETHDLVEKKDSKLRRLEKEIEEQKNKIKKCEDIIDSYSKKLKEEEDKLKNLSDEQLESRGLK